MALDQRKLFFGSDEVGKDQIKAKKIRLSLRLKRPGFLQK
jgi:hypothetical protein